MGFNDRFSHEHYGIIVRHMRVDRLNGYEIAQGVAQLVMAGLLFWCWREKVI